MPVSPAAIASLRARTGVAMLACKEALEEAGGDEEKAIDLLRKRGIAQAAKKAARDQAEGLIFLKEGAGKVALLQLRCETDFVARDQVFQSLGTAFIEALLTKGTAALTTLADERLPDAVQKLGENITLGESAVVESGIIGTYLHSNAKIGVVVALDGGTKEQAHDVAMHAAAMNPLYVTPDEAPEELLTKEREIWVDQLKNDKKPPEIKEKILTGKERKFREEHALLKQPFAKDPQKTIEQYLGAAKVTKYVRLAV